MPLPSEYFNIDPNAGELKPLEKRESPTVVNLEKPTKAELDRLQRQIDDINLSTDPKNSASKGQINWLGSSFTGQDIKVVAHLYPDSEQEELDLMTNNSDEKYCQLLIQAIDMLFPLIPLEGLSYHLYQSYVNNIINNLRVQLSEDDGGAFSRIENELMGAYESPKASKRFKSISQNLTTIQQKTLSLLENLQKQNLDKERYLSDKRTVVLGTLQTLSISSFRDRNAIRSLGTSYVKGYTNGPRTIAGSMIFTLFEEHPLVKLTRALSSLPETNPYYENLTSVLPDQLPPIDISIVFANEYGTLSRQTIYGVQFVSDAATYSIENLLTEQVMQFVCRDVDIMTAQGSVKLSAVGKVSQSSISNLPVTGTSLIGSNKDYDEYLEKLSLRNRFGNR